MLIQSRQLKKICSNEKNCVSMYHLFQLFGESLKNKCPKIKLLSWFTHPHDFPNLYVPIFSVEHKGRTRNLWFWNDMIESK